VTFCTIDAANVSALTHFTASEGASHLFGWSMLMTVEKINNDPILLHGFPTKWKAILGR